MTTQKDAHQKQQFDKSRFHRAFLAAEYVECRQILQSLGRSDEAVLLEANISWREQKYVEMIESLSALVSKNWEVSLERDVLLGAAYGCSSEFIGARMKLDRVFETVPQASPLRDDALFYKALVAWMDYEHRESETIARKLVQKGSPNNRARAHILLSWIALRRRNVAQQVEELVHALNVLEETDEPDAYYRAKALMTLALLCRELPLSTMHERIHRTYAAMRWTDGIQPQHFQTTRFLGWIDALQGNELAAFRWFRTASTLAPSDHWRVLCLTDRAYLARNTGERSYGLDLLQTAHELAEKLSWSHTADQERSALIVLAELFADINPALAQAYLAQFRSLGTSVLPGVSYSTDPRVRAFAAYSSGMALLRLNEQDEATAMLTESLEIFRAFDYGWRAALCAYALYNATGNLTWLTEARRQIAPWPRSWIAREIAAGSKSGDSRLLSGAQRRVLNLLLEGKSNVGIAKALRRSPYTVRNHIAQLFKTYGVTSRTQLASLFTAKTKF